MPTGDLGGVSGYELYRSDSISGKYTKIKTLTNGSTVSYTNSGLKKGKVYYYKLKSYRVVDGKKVYSGCSTIKGIKIK